MYNREEDLINQFNSLIDYTGLTNQDKCKTDVVIQYISKGFIFVAQKVGSLIADPGDMSLSPVRSHNFMEIGRKIFSTVILLLRLIQERLLLVTSKSMCTLFWLTA